MTFSARAYLILGLTGLGPAACLWATPALAQAPRDPLPSLDSPLPNRPFPDQQPPEMPLPDQPLPPLPSPDELLSPDQPLSPDGSLEAPDDTFLVQAIQVTGSTVFSQADFADLTAPYLGRQVSFDELLQLRAAITERYVEAGYITSGALIPPQTLIDNTVTIQVIEGRLEDIVVTGTNRLSPGYVRSRIQRVAEPPLNVDNLLEGLQQLQLDPLIDTISADLQAGISPGTSRLVVEVAEADSFAVNTALANDRSPNIGGTQRTLGLSEGNLFGLGDRFALDYKNTDGSDGFDVSYTLPVSPNNDTLNLEAGYSDSRVIDSDFSVLDISSNSFYYELAYRHPLIQTPTEELALGLALSHQESQIQSGLIDSFQENESESDSSRQLLSVLSPGADENGFTRTTALRLFQEWTQRSQSHVLALRSQFSLGLRLLNATVNDSDNVNEMGPDSQFFSWRGQGQWVRLLGEDTLFLLRGDVQLTADDLLPQEEFGLGGARSVRGYRQDERVRDNGALLSAELHLPIARIPEWDGVLQVTPFVDAGVAWDSLSDSSEVNNSDPNALIGAGLGLLWQQGNNFEARLDWGLPLVDVFSENDSLQESGIYFSIRYTPF